MKTHTILISNFHRHGGGHCVYVHLLAKNLRLFGHRPIVACPRESYLARDCKETGIEVADAFLFEGGFTPFSFHKDVATARRVTDKYNVDLIHVNGSRDHWVMATNILLSRRNVALVRTRQNTKAIKNNPLNRKLNQKHTDHTITPCNHIKEIYAESPIFVGCGVTAIHHGVEIENFSPMLPDTRIQKELGLSTTDFIIGMVGRLEWDKGHKYLFEAVAPLIKGEFSNIRLLLVGFGGGGEELRKMCQEMGISDRVIFAGRRSDMREVVSAFDIGAHPSIGVDTSSFAMKEMMAMEKPIVSSDYGGLIEIADDGITGYVVPARDPVALRDRIVKLYNSAELRKKMGRAAREKVEREFTAEIMARRTLVVYERVIQDLHKSERP